MIFIDVHNFQHLMEKMSPVALVTLLDRIYSLFDEICALFDVQKMETVGKTYMACTGLQGECPESASVRSAALALHILRTIDEVSLASSTDNLSDSMIELRIGVHSGQVISGLVGMKKQQFSLFGDTVNTASRMQSNGIVGKCHISQATYELIKDTFDCEPRSIEVKGKGRMTTYIIKDAKSSYKRDSNRYSEDTTRRYSQTSHASHEHQSTYVRFKKRNPHRRTLSWFLDDYIQLLTLYEYGIHIL